MYKGIGKKRRAIMLVTLIIAGESAFLLPFVLARVCRSTLLNGFLFTGLWQ